MNFFGRIREALRRYDDAHNFTCDICGREVFDGERVCAACYRALPWIKKPYCPLCGRQLGEEGICLECKEKPLAAEKVRSAFIHEEEAARLVVRFKKGRKYLYRTIADLLYPQFIKEFPLIDAIAFVPMTERAERKRGYNQSRLIAEELSRRSGKPVLALLTKKCETPSQKTLSRREREKNLEGCFSAEKTEVKSRRILIVDDTFTTGSTLGELATTLLKAGAKSVEGLTVTSVRNKNPFGKPPEKTK